MFALALLILALLFFGFGFAVQILWYAAVIMVILAVVSYVMRGNHRTV